MKNNYKLKIICLLCVLTAAFSSCKKNELVEEQRLTNNHNNYAYTGHPKYHVLGYGYDITGRLANAESAKLSVLNIDKYISENPALFSQNDDVNDYFEYSYGENAESYSKKLTQKYKLSLDLNFLKVAKLFKGELNASFAKKDSTYAKYVYASVRKMIKQRSMKIYFTKENLANNYLTDQFKFDLVSLSATALVERYGTHVLTDIELGARLDMNYEAQTNNSKREEAATAGASLSVGKIFNVSADITTNSVDANSNFNQRLYYNSVGGDGTKSLIGEIALDNSIVKINIGNWQSSCNKDNAALIKIAEDGLISLEDLINDPVKKQQVKAAVEQYIIDRQIKMINEVPAPQNGTFMRNESTGQVYIVMDGKLRYIPNQSVLYGLFEFNESMLNHYSNVDISKFPFGVSISPDNGLINNIPSGIVYFREGNLIRRIPNMEVKSRYHFNWNSIRNVNGINGYTVGENMTL